MPTTPRGDPEDALSDHEMSERFRRFAGVLASERAAAIEQCVATLDRLYLGKRPEQRSKRLDSSPGEPWPMKKFTKQRFYRVHEPSLRVRHHRPGGEAGGSAYFESPGADTVIPRSFVRSMAFCTRPDALASSTNSLM